MSETTRNTDAAWKSFVGLDPCVYCCAPSQVWDHIIPFSRGGSDNGKNRAPACERCDRLKADRGPVEYLFALQKANRTIVRRRYANPNHRQAAFNMMLRRGLVNPQSRTAEQP